jgi:SAM-dependent methyltransferase
MGKENKLTDQSQTPNLSAIKDRQQKTWTSGDYARIGNTLVIIGELLCEAVNVRSGQKVLDVATGSGNTAISAARRFCDVTGIDYVPELIEYARKRAADPSHAGRTGRDYPEMVGAWALHGLEGDPRDSASTAGGVRADERRHPAAIYMR